MLSTNMYAFVLDSAKKTIKPKEFLTIYNNSSYHLQAKDLLLSQRCSEGVSIRDILTIFAYFLLPE